MKDLEDFKLIGYHFHYIDKFIVVNKAKEL